MLSPARCSLAADNRISMFKRVLWHWEGHLWESVGVEMHGGAWRCRDEQLALLLLQHTIGFSILIGLDPCTEGFKHSVNLDL